MSWTFESDTGKLYRPDGSFFAKGYAGGNEGKNPEGINNPLMQSVWNVGPLPIGLYTFGEVVMESKLGPFAIPLIPDKENEMFGRGHFYMHGDTAIPGHASEGCIIMPRPVREEVYSSTDRTIQVKVSDSWTGKK